MTATHTTPDARKSSARTLPARHGVVRWAGSNDIARRALLDCRGAELAVRLDGSEVWTNYLLEPVVGPAGLEGWRLTRFDDGGSAVYCLPADLSGCSCPDTKYRARRREDGACKHRKLVAAALKQIGLLTE